MNTPMIPARQQGQAIFRIGLLAHIPTNSRGNDNDRTRPYGASRKEEQSVTDRERVSLIRQMICDFWGVRGDDISAGEFSVLIEMISTVADFGGGDNGN